MGEHLDEKNPSLVLYGCHLKLEVRPLHLSSAEKFFDSKSFFLLHNLIVHFFFFEVKKLLRMEVVARCPLR